MDHPRVCGEQGTSGYPIWAQPGSPPRVRGTVPCASDTTQGYGITPACAGNSAEPPCCGIHIEDHPRVCGEQAKGQIGHKSTKGSPPRVRGTEGHSVMGKQVPRITPACAGNRRTARCPPEARKDHPRVCGEQLAMIRGASPTSGSPPRVRGTVSPLQRAQRHQGITPACAGNRTKTTYSNAETEDHPRVCGEQEFSWSTTSAPLGSPPRVRGTGSRCCPPRTI